VGFAVDLEDSRMSFEEDLIAFGGTSDLRNIRVDFDVRIADINLEAQSSLSVVLLEALSAKSCFS